MRICCIIFVVLYLQLFVVAIVIVQMCLAFKKGLSRSLQERSLDIGRALNSETLVQSSLEDCRANVEQFNASDLRGALKSVNR
jgi:sensor histidine kinase regulating citrate/malate metabolism